MRFAPFVCLVLLAPSLTAQSPSELETSRLLEAQIASLDKDAGGFCGAVLVASKGKILLEQLGYFERTD